MMTASLLLFLILVLLLLLFLRQFLVFERRPGPNGPSASAQSALGSAHMHARSLAHHTMARITSNHVLVSPFNDRAASTKTRSHMSTCRQRPASPKFPSIAPHPFDSRVGVMMDNTSCEAAVAV